MFPALHAKKVILGISGSIAAYKTPLLVRALVKAGAEVQVVMTPSSKSFVAPLSLSTVSNRAVYSEFVESEEELWNNHGCSTTPLRFQQTLNKLLYSIL